MRPFDIITFDCYGTLIDWELGLSRAFVDAAAKDGVALDAARVIEAYHREEPVVEQEVYRPYREVLRLVALRVAASLGWTLAEEKADFLSESLPDWPPFKDTNISLERLSHAGYELGILSNVDDDLLAATRRHFSVPFPLVITAAQVQSYKPAHGHFVAAEAQMNGRRWLHAAQSWFHDVVPCRQRGIRSAWVNRKSEAPKADARADFEVPDLAGLAQWLTQPPA